MPVVPNTFGARLRDRRRELGITQSGIGDTVGRSKTAVSHWEGGRSEPSLVDLAMLATGLGVTVDYLVLGDRAGVILLGADEHAPLLFEEAVASG